MSRPQLVREGADRVPKFYSVAQVAEILGVSAMTVYRAIAAKELPATRIMGRLIVPARALDRLAEAALQEVMPADR